LENVIMHTDPRNLLIAVAALALAACASQIQHKEKTADTAREVSSDIQATNTQIDATLASLDALTSADGTELKPAFDRYSKDIDKTRARAREIDADAAALQRQSQTYLTNWEKEHNDIQNAELRRTSEQRRQTVMARFQNLQNAYDNAHTSLDQFLRNHEDVRTALRTDLTPRGVAAVANSDTVQNARTSGDNVKDSLQKVQSDAEALANALQPLPPVASPNAPAQTGSTTTTQ
jgi:chromosome segregation ATPase